MEIRKKITNKPVYWSEATISVEDVGAYAMDAMGRMEPVQTTKARMGEFTGMRERLPATEMRRQRFLAKLPAMREQVVVFPNLVLFVPDEGAFYKFDHFTKKYVVFKYLRDV